MLDNFDPLDLFGPGADQAVASHLRKKQVLLSYGRGGATQESFASYLSECLSGRISNISYTYHDVPIDQFGIIAICSRIAIIIFSKHYASSRRCLEELTKIMEFCPKILPIFYDLCPSDVYNQESSFGEAFRGLIQRISTLEDEASTWREALIDAGGRTGIVVPHDEYNDTSQVIQAIVSHVQNELYEYLPFEGPIGVNPQVQEVITMLEEHNVKDVVSIGIWGMAGIGKTTLAELIFDRIGYKFQSTCFLSNVRGTWKREGKVYLQIELLSVICGSTDLRLDDIESVSLNLKEKPCHKKVLVVLDDVNHLEQLHALCGSSEWFGQGSRIIITTRDYHQLRAFKVDHIYSMKFLDKYASIQLFVKTAFKHRRLEEQHVELSKMVVACAEGLPLSLTGLGSMFSQLSLTEWESALMRISTNLPSIIYHDLKFSFDSLDANEKEIFLNIVLFYIGEYVNDVMQKLDDRGCNATVGIKALVDRSLITIDKDNKLRMHNMLQLMGRKIMHEISKNEIESHGHRYEVLLSFRGEDTRTNFTSHLYSALCNAGITVSKDDVELQRGSHIKTELLQAIGGSKIAIIIFSREYAGSRWCLKEMSMIMELHISNGQVVLPVFYNVDPSEIRNQTSCFGDSFKDLIQRISPPEYLLYKWRTILVEAGAIAGFVVLGSRDESEHVKAIVDKCL